MEHADFNGVGPYVVEHRPNLAGNEFNGNRVDVGDADGVFVNNGDYGRGAVASTCRKGFQVGLNAGSAAGVAAGNGQHATVA